MPNNQLGTVTENTTSSPSPPHRRTGCSPQAVILIGLLLLISLGVFVYYGLVQHDRTLALNGLSASEIQAFDEWLETPIVVPEEWWRPRTASRHTLDAREQIISDLESIRPTMQPIIDAPGHLWQRVLRGELSTDDELTSALQSTEPLVPIMEQVKLLVDQPDYTFNLPDDIGYSEPSYYYPYMSRSLQFIRPALAVLSGDYEEAIAQMDSTMKFFRWKPPTTPTPVRFALPIAYVSTRFTLLLESHTTDPRHLQLMLNVLNDRRIDLLGTDGSSAYVYADTTLYTAMVNDGYLRNNTRTIQPQELATAFFHMERYGEYVDHHYPAGNQHREYVKRQVDRYISEIDKPGKTGNLFLDTVRRVTKPPTYRKIMQTYGETFWRMRNLQRSWLFQQGDWAVAQRSTTQYDLTRLWLARRIAELRGEALPVTESDFVPRYLPDWPADPYSPAGEGFLFNAARGEFYSIGEDATPGTNDDVYLEPLVPEKSPAEDAAPLHRR